LSALDLRPPTAGERALITAGLTPEERDVPLQHGTEAPFCGVFLDNHQAGIYTCRFCGFALFHQDVAGTS
jgi:peptide-methionine (R)-S-oxide reductase